MASANAGAIFLQETLCRPSLLIYKTPFGRHTAKINKELIINKICRLNQFLPSEIAL